MKIICNLIPIIIIFINIQTNTVKKKNKKREIVCFYNNKVKMLIL